MREEVKEIFNNPQTLRQKLAEYFNTYDRVKIEYYATSAETFFLAGGKQGICYKESWSWLAFFFADWFFIYKKEYLKGIAILIFKFFGFLATLSNINSETLSDAEEIMMLAMLVISVASGIYAKYIVIKRFELSLNSNENMFKLMSGENTWAIWAGVVVYFIYISLLIIA